MHWPDIPYERWKDTGASLHMWSQIAGKFRLAYAPWQNHSWHATFYVTARGLSSSAVHTHGSSYEVLFDFLDHRLVVQCASGAEAGFALEPMSVAAFHQKFTAALESVGAPTRFHGSPNEVPDPVPFLQQTTPGAYDPQAAHDYWCALRAMFPVFSQFRAEFLGKSSPVHLFWGSFDLAVTRFSGRPAPLHPGGFPALPDAVTQEAYSHEVSSAGFWPGGGGIDEAAFYSYAYPVPEGFSTVHVTPAAAHFHDALGEFILPYDAVRLSSTPEADLLSFLRSTYAVAADLASWDRAALDRPEGVLGKPPPLKQQRAPQSRRP